MRQIGRAAVAVACVFGSSAGAQVIIDTAITAPGDYLRGVGIAAAGLGQYNLNTAQAQSILADTAITVDQYIRTVRDAENRERARRRAQRMAESLKYYTKARARVLDTPDEIDIRMGDAQNALINWLNQGEVATSGIRYTPVVLPADVVRRIPFKLDEEGAVLSLPRLTHRAKASWPVAFQDPAFDRERTAYDRAMNHALDQQIEGKMSMEAIARVDDAIAALSRRLDALVPAADRDLYNPARAHLRELDQAFKQLKSHKVEAATAELDTYAGTTVDDLRMFMLRHKLGFAPADRPDERTAYREIYGALAAQRAALDPDRPESK